MSAEPKGEGDPVVYIARDAHGCVLYVGATCEPRYRLQWHKRSAKWWLATATIEVEPHATLAQAREIESELIARLRPPFNRNGVGGWLRPEPSVVRKAAVA